MKSIGEMKPLFGISLVLGVGMTLMSIAHSQTPILTPEQQRLEEKQLVIDCVKQAEHSYRDAWKRECVARSEGLGPPCQLPRPVAQDLGNDMKSARDLCFQAQGAGLYR
jgi:hypothetical protein